MVTPTSTEGKAAVEEVVGESSGLLPACSPYLSPAAIYSPAMIFDRALAPLYPHSTPEHTACGCSGRNPAMQQLLQWKQLWLGSGV